MYNWRNMSPEQRLYVIRQRQLYRYPVHSPPHSTEPGTHRYHLSAANYEHATILGTSPERLAAFAAMLCEVLTADATLHAWCVLPNHYHALLAVGDLKTVLSRIGQLHGRTSFAWNREDDAKGRKCWHCCADRRIRSESHFYVARNYIHHNPVKHGFASQWADWPFSSARDFLDEVAREQSLEFWQNYPVLDMGKGWDWDE